MKIFDEDQSFPFGMESETIYCTYMPTKKETSGPEEKYIHIHVCVCPWGWTKIFTVYKQVLRKYKYSYYLLLYE